LKLKAAVQISLIILLTTYAAIASQGISIGIGIEYMPVGKIEYGNPPTGNRYEFYDNMSVESGLYYNFETGFRTGAFLSLLSKNTELTNSTVDISYWGVGLLGDYEYEITETGTTRLVFGFDSGYGKFNDKNDNGVRSDESFWVAGFGGVRYFFSDRYFFEFDYRMKWQEFNLSGVPEKAYLFSGSNLRIALGYGFFTGRNPLEKIK